MPLGRATRMRSGRESFVRALEVPGAEAYRGRHQWSNDDLDPTPVGARKWTKWDYAAVWWGTSFGAVSWASGSALVSIGLSFTQAIGTSLVGSAIGAVASVLNARQGALYHVGYPITVRSQMGVYGGYFFVFLRAVVAIIWFGIQSYYTGRLFSVSLRCVFGEAWMRLKPFPTSAGITSQDFTAFMLIYTIQLPLMFIHPANIRRLFELKAVLVPPCAFALTIWACVKAGGFSRFDLATKTTLEGTSLFWAWMKCINAVLSTVSPLIINQPDLARYSTRPSEAGWYQGLALFLVKNIVAFLSIATASALKVMYGGPALWNLWDQLGAILDHEWNAAARACVFLVATVFVFATILTNVSANSIPFGADFTGILPRFLTIRRGQVICWVLGLAIVPWKFMVDAAKFITFLGSYTILMGSLLGVIFCDFFVLRRGNIHIPSCYTGDQRGLYYFTRGVNWRGCVAWFVGFIVPFPGLLGAYGIKVGSAALRMYESGWLLSVTLAFVVHYILNRLWPVPVYPASHSYVSVEWEHLGDQSRNGLFDDEEWHGPAGDSSANTANVSPTESVHKGDDDTLTLPTDLENTGSSTGVDKT